MPDALNDWINLLQGPAEPPFGNKTTFPEGWQHLLRLILLVLVMLVAVLAITYLGSNAAARDGSVLAAFMKNTAQQTQYTIFVILLGALFAALYSFTMAPLFKIDINLRQAFFTVLFMVLPWIPIVILVWALVFILSPAKVPLLAIFIIVFLYIAFPIIAVIQFSRGVTLVSGCPKRKCLASIAIPAAVLALLLGWMWLSLPASEPDEATAAASAAVPAGD